MSANLPLTVVQRGGGSIAGYLQDMFRFRDALQFMVRRDVKVRYTQTVIGFGWAVLQPLTQVVVFSVFFGHLAGVSADGVPYPVFSVAGVIPWTYFSVAATMSTTTLVGGGSLLSKIYVPRALMPLTPVLACLLDFVIGIGLLVAVLVGVRTLPAGDRVSLPAVPHRRGRSRGARVRDLARPARGAVPGRALRRPFLIQTLMFVTPVIYAATLVPASLRPLYALNPMVGVVTGFRSAFLGMGAMPWGSIGLSCLVSIALIAAGLAYFRRVERIFADIA